MKISVTNTDIYAGQRNQLSHCPLALALQRVTGKRWWVDYRIAKFWDGDKFQECSIPQNSVWRLERWDRGERMIPFSVNLELLGKSLLREFISV